MKTIPIIYTEHLILTVLKPAEYLKLFNYQWINHQHLKPWEPLRDEAYLSDGETKKRVKANFELFQSGVYIPLVGLDKRTGKIVCCAYFSNIVHGAFQACHLGYSINQQDQGKGLMFEMLEAGLQHVFTDYQLHRIMASYIPTNTRSANLLKRLGFEKEGIAKSYLKIAGEWQDHVLTSKLYPEFNSA
jgi:ribosomal-protein-alanine N-acetyltransferase